MTRSNRLIILTIAVLTLVMLLAAMRSYSFAILLGEEPQLTSIAQRHLVIWVPWILFCPFLLWLIESLIQRFKLSWTLLLFGILGSLLIIPVHVFFMLVANIWLRGPDFIAQYGLEEILLNYAFQISFLDPFVFFVLGGLTILNNYLDTYTTLQKRTLAIQSTLSQISISTLRMQLHPHFLFNTLHNIHSLLTENTKDAKQVTENLIHLLTSSFDSNSSNEISLEEEIQFLVKYLEIEKFRFQDQFHFDVDLDSHTPNLRVPRLLLQPFVENAVKHGLSKQLGRGEIKISSGMEEAHLVLTVEDNGVGLPKHGKLEEGLGWSTTRKRLENLYEDFSLAWMASELGGLKVEIKIPVNYE